MLNVVRSKRFSFCKVVSIIYSFESLFLKANALKLLLQIIKVDTETKDNTCSYGAD